MIIIRCVTVR